MYFVGIDVGKSAHEALILDQQGEQYGETLSIPNSRAGISTFSERLTALEAPVKIAL
jgi:transposase